MKICCPEAAFSMHGFLGTSASRLRSLLNACNPLMQEQEREGRQQSEHAWVNT